MLLAVATHYTSVLYIERNLIFDDSFIAYRYALNLAEGYGITWNRLENPTEGYTSFLHIIMLAPFIRLGIEPLFAARAMSVLSGIGIAVLVGSFARKHYDASWPVTALVGMSYLPLGYTAFLSTVGLETIIYTFFLFASFYCFTMFFWSRKMKHFALFCVMQFVSFLARPEALLLSVPMVIMLIIEREKSGLSLLAMIRTYMLLFLMPLTVYFAWKKMHFGYFLPNPFYLKVGVSNLKSFGGSETVIDFFQSELGLLGVVLISFAISHKMAKARHRLFCIIFITIYSMFYLHVSPLMFVKGRYMYPVTPFLYFMAIPSAVALFSSLLDKEWNFLIKVPFTVATSLVILVVLSPTDLAVDIKAAVRGEDLGSNRSVLMKKEYMVAERLRKYPGIKNVSIALADAGVIPYFTEAEVLDYVGLNDSFIARERDRKKLVDYFFSKKPLIVILSSNKELDWISYGHGPLGNLTRWISDPRWDGYGYAGTVFTDIYNLQFYIRKDCSEFKKLSSFIKKNVAEKVYKYPLLTGTRYLAH
jgi:hypothetical protein